MMSKALKYRFVSLGGVGLCIRITTAEYRMQPLTGIPDLELDHLILQAALLSQESGCWRPCISLHRKRGVAGAKWERKREREKQTVSEWEKKRKGEEKGKEGESVRCRSKSWISLPKRQTGTHARMTCHATPIISIWSRTHLRWLAPCWAGTRRSQTEEQDSTFQQRPHLRLETKEVVFGLEYQFNTAPHGSPHMGHSFVSAWPMGQQKTEGGCKGWFLATPYRPHMCICISLCFLLICI